MKIRHLFAAALLALAAIASEANPIRIGLLPAADSIVITVAADEGIFKGKELEVEPIPFRSALEIGSAMRAGALDGHFGDLMNVLSQNASGVRQAVILTTTRTNEGQRCFGLAVSPKLSGSIKSVSDLNGAGTAMSTSTIIDYLLDRMREQEKLPSDAIKDVEIRQIPVRLQMLMAGKVDAALLPEPLLTAAERQGARVVWDDRKLDEPLAVVSLKQELLDPRTVKAFGEAVSEAARRIEADPGKYRALMVKKRLLPKDGAESYPMVRFSLFGTKDGLPPLPTEEEVRRVGEWMTSKGMLKSVPDFKDVVYQAP
ncbi:MAG: ABC transporter substrate-binding protein [Aeromonadales bacterium]|nr:ABC transporter substrate-binding protein [Aeromonadales bacterium]MDY2889952.1 ABC transporter substrate-binding protein [Succinivibrio sp.]